MSEEIDTLKKEIAVLRGELERRTPEAVIASQVREQVKEHREYLESLLDKALRVMYVVAGFLVGVAGLLGIKTYWDVEERLKDGAQEQVEKFITREYVDDLAQARLDRYDRGAMIAYLKAKSSDPEWRQSKAPLTESELTALDGILQEPSSPFFRDALGILALLEVTRTEHADRFGAPLLHILDGYWSKGQPQLSEAVQLQAIESLRHLGHHPAAPVLLRHGKSGILPGAVRRAVFEALPVLTDSSDQATTAESLVRDAPSWRVRDRSIYKAMMISAFKLVPTSTFSELEALAGKADFDSRFAFASLLSDLLDAQINDETRRNRLSKIISKYIQSSQMRFESPDHLVNPFDRPTLPYITLWVAQDEGGGASGIRLSYSAATSGIFVGALADAFSAADRKAISVLIRKTLVPLLDLSASVFEHEKETGQIGENSAPSTWRDALILLPKTTSGSDTRRWELISLKDDAQISVREVGSESSQMVAVEEVDWGKTTWSHRSFTSSLESPFRRMTRRFR